MRVSHIGEAYLRFRWRICGNCTRFYLKCIGKGYFGCSSSAYIMPKEGNLCLPLQANG